MCGLRLQKVSPVVIKLETRTGNITNYRANHGGYNLLLFNGVLNGI